MLQVKFSTGERGGRGQDGWVGLGLENRRNWAVIKCFFFNKYDMNKYFFLVGILLRKGRKNGDKLEIYRNNG